MVRWAILVIFITCLIGIGTTQENSRRGLNSYRDDPRGLKILITDLMEARRKQDSDGFSRLARTLVLSNHRDWFGAAFGPDMGTDFADEYPSDAALLQNAFGKIFDEMISSKLTNVQVDRFDQACDSSAEADQYPVLIALKKRVPIYQVLFCDAGQTIARRLWAFAYVDGSFRYLQNLQIRETRRKSEPQRLSVSAEVLESKLTHIERPVYPQAAVAKHLQGTVKLWVTVTEEGLVKDAQVTEGICILSRAAIEAVKKWRYTPTLVNGVPTEVRATVQVKFQLGSR